MDRDTKLFYLLKIKNKLDFKIQNSNNYLFNNELIKYLEICIDICNLLEKRYFGNVKDIRDLFLLIQATIKNKDFYNARELVKIKIKELESSGKQSSSNKIN